jgi:cell division protein ZapA (FtsZ GTPase activity inhibitor)
VSVSVANTRLTVPIVRDEETTHQIAALVDAQFRELEDQDIPIDTQRFALLTAFSFAAQHFLLEEQIGSDERELLATLDGVCKMLEAAAERAATISETC